MLAAIPLTPELAMLAATIAVTGFSATFISNLIGSGAGLIIIPVLQYIFMLQGLDSSAAMLMTVGTVSVAMIFGSTRAIRMHQRFHNIDWQVMRHWIIPMLVGVLLAKYLGISGNGHNMKLVFATITLLLAAYILLGHEKYRLGDKIPLGPIWWSFGLVVGFLGSCMGVAGAIFVIPLMMAYGMSLRKAMGTCAPIGLVVGIPTAILYFNMPSPAADLSYTTGAINWLVAAIMIPACSLGAGLGIWLQQRIPTEYLRYGFVTLLLVSSCRFYYLTLAGL